MSASLSETVAALRRRDLSAVELTERAIARHATHDEALHAYKYFDEAGALAAARAADEGIGFTDTPGSSMSISRKVMPSCLGASGLVRTSAKIQSDSCA